MKKLQKMIVREGLEISQENIYDGVFIKVTYLQFSDCNSSIKRLPHRSFLEYVSKVSCLKKIWWTSVLIKLSWQSRQLYQKREVILDPSVEAL